MPSAGQYDPIITQDNSTLGVPEGKDGQQYYFPDDLTDKAVEWLHGVRAQDAAKPWFMYYSTGCSHAPHHVAKAWADKYHRAGGRRAARADDGRRDHPGARDLADEHPDKLAELKELWWAEAERNRVLPLLGALCVMFGILPPLPTITRFTFAGDVQNVQRGMIPRIYGRSYAIEAELEVPEAGAEGVIVANADFIGGFALWVDGNHMLHHTYSFVGVETYKQIATEPIPTGPVSVKMLFAADEAKPGTGGTVALHANGKVIGEGKMPHTVPVGFSTYAGMDIGRDNGLVVDLDYEDKAPYAFTGTVKKVVFDLKPATHEDEKALHEHARMHGIGQGAAG